MKTHQVDLVVKDYIGIITINNPPHNSLTRLLLEDCVQILDSVQKTPVRVVIVTGSPKSFCSGVDLQELRSIHRAPEARELAKKGQTLLRKIETYHIPVLAAINGVCLGGGAELALSCHMRYCSDNAAFGFPELSLGIIPAFGGTRLLPKAVGYGKALELILRGTMINAREARELGLVEGVFPRKSLLREVTYIAKGVAHTNPHAVQIVMESILSTRRNEAFASPIPSLPPSSRLMTHPA